MAGKKSSRAGIFWFLGFVLSAVCAVWGTGASYNGFMTPRASLDRFLQIHADGWIEDGSSIYMPNLAPIGNNLVLNLKDWRPGGAGPAHLVATVCGEQVSDFLVVANGEYTISLKGDCEPRKLSIQVVNPVVASATDQRKLGAQLQSARVTSRLRVPLVRVDLILETFVAMFSIFVVYALLLAPWKLGWLASIFPLVGAYFLTEAVNLNYGRVLALWLFFAPFGFGMLLYLKNLREGRSSQSREATQQQVGRTSLPTYGALLLIVAGAAALRFYGLNFGLPNNYHPDEVPKVNAIMRMIEHGDLNPRYFLHPSLLLYLTYFTNYLFHLFGMGGEFRDSAFLAGRVVSATAGTLSVYLLFCMGKRIYSAQVGLLSAALLAVYPLHVTCSRYMKEDALLLFTTLLALVILLKAVYEDKKPLLLLAGLCAGFSASSKYSGLLTVFMVGSAPWIRSRSLIPNFSYIPWTAAALALAPLGFVICTPYSVLSFPKFLKDFNSERNHMQRGHTIPFDAWSQYWTYHYYRSIIPGMTMVSTIIAVIGVGILAARRRVEDLIVLGLIFVFYAPAEWVKAKPAPQPERYILPCLPFLALAAAQGLAMVRAGRARLLVPILALVAVVAPLIRSAELASEVAHDTRSELADWMVKNLPHGSRVLLDWKPYAPRFWNNEFEVIYVPRATILENLQIGNLKSANASYLVLSSLFYDRYFSQPHLDPALRERFREVFDRVPIIKDITPKYGTYGFNNPSLTLFSLKPEDFARLEQELQDKRDGKIEQTSNQKISSFRWWRTEKR